MVALLFIAMLATPSFAQNSGTCNGKDSCPWKCCRGNPGAPKCWCSRCCLAKDRELGPDDRAQIFEEGDRVISVFRQRVEFLRRGDAAARKIRRFSQGILPVEEESFGDGRVLVCTSAELPATPSKGAEGGFCGAFDADGNELFRLRSKEAAGVERSARAIRKDGKEALFTLTKPRPSGDREIVGYRIWRKGKPEEHLAPDGPRTRAVLEAYEGRIVLPDPHEGH